MNVHLREPGSPTFINENTFQTQVSINEVQRGRRSAIKRSHTTGAVAGTEDNDDELNESVDFSVLTSQVQYDRRVTVNVPKKANKLNQDINLSHDSITGLAIRHSHPAKP